MRTHSHVSLRVSDGFILESSLCACCVCCMCCAVRRFLPCLFMMCCVFTKQSIHNKGRVAELSWKYHFWEQTYCFFLRQNNDCCLKASNPNFWGAWRLLYSISLSDVKILKVVSLYLIISTIEIDTFYDRRWTALTVYCMRHINTFSGHSSVQRSTIMLPYSLSLSPKKTFIGGLLA